MDLHDVVMRLVGPVNPIGKTEVDSDRYANLEELLVLTNQLLGTIIRVADENAHRVEASLKKAGVRCHEFLAEVAVDVG